ncbi:MAG: hypothetical protein JWR69_4129 [Pedosphaera sp.]|nr:hypothetical protein [Pedosphaera sp.]
MLERFLTTLVSKSVAAGAQDQAFVATIYRAEQRPLSYRVQASQL